MKEKERVMMKSHSAAINERASDSDGGTKKKTTSDGRRASCFFL